VHKTKLIFAILMTAFPAARSWAVQAPKTVLDGAYTEMQANRGAAQYDQHCANCHEGVCSDGPPLFGPQFIDRWREDTLDFLFTNMRTRMPRDSAGSLNDGTYLDVLAYILQKNRYPAGSKELDTDAVRTTLLVGKDGPKPLPSNALVQVIGCLEAGPNNVWNLTNATDLVRTRKGDEIDADEAKRAATVALGTSIFRLPNATSFRPGFKPDAFNGHKVLAKGALARQSNGDRINLTALETVAPSCAQ
jgi:mono/diheme cytochrome c family protein